MKKKSDFCDPNILVSKVKQHETVVKQWTWNWVGSINNEEAAQYFRICVRISTQPALLLSSSYHHHHRYYCYYWHFENFNQGIPLLFSVQKTRGRWRLSEFYFIIIIHSKRKRNKVANGNNLIFSITSCYIADLSFQNSLLFYFISVLPIALRFQTSASWKLRPFLNLVRISYKFAVIKHIVIRLTILFINYIILLWLFKMRFKLKSL